MPNNPSGGAYRAAPGENATSCQSAGRIPPCRRHEHHRRTAGIDATKRELQWDRLPQQLWDAIEGAAESEKRRADLLEAAC